MKPQLSIRARGRWHGILTSLGVDPRYLTGKHTACPLCQAGKDRFRFDDKEGRGTWICSACGKAGDGIKLLMELYGWSFGEMARQVEGVIETAPTQPAKSEMSDRERRERLNRLWRETKRVERGDPVARWLARRGLGDLQVPGYLRTAPRCHYEGDSYHPAMVAMLLGPDGEPVTLHRTYLTEDGRKADVEAQRRLMPGAGSLPEGSAVPLAPCRGVLGIAEGIETALSATKLFDVPCWAAISDGRLASWKPPEGVTEVWVFGDCDDSFAGQAAAYKLAKQLKSKRYDVQVKIPEAIGTDWNDVLLSEKSEAA